jgi:hypothetical protein
LRTGRPFASVVVAGCLLPLWSCGLFDSGIEWRSGPYALTWIDLPEEVHLSYDEGHGGWATLIEPRVFSVGSNEQYVVAKQHPGGNKNVTNDFIITRIEKRVGQRWIEIERGLLGPLTAQQFQEKAETLKLPPFTKTLASLE